MLGVFLRAVSGWYRRRARALGYADGRTGAVTVIQRANSDLRLAPHFHSLLLDGVCVGDDAGAPDRLAEEEPVLAGLLQASVMDTSVTGERAGRRIRRVLSDPAPGQRTGDLCCQGESSPDLCRRREGAADAPSQHRELCRYVLRPPLANSRLRWLDDDTLLLALKRKWDDGTSHLLLSASELLARLAALVPPKGFNLTQYHGCLAPRSRLRELVIPAPPDPGAHASNDGNVPRPPETVPARPRRIPWAELLRRVFRSDMALAAAPSRVEQLKRISAPTLVVHGDEDIWIQPAHGEALAAAIPGAKLLWVKGGGHAFPLGIHTDYIADVVDHLKGAQQ